MKDDVQEPTELELEELSDDDLTSEEMDLMGDVTSVYFEDAETFEEAQLLSEFNY